jgi:phenylacetate-CoA ligase
MYYGEQMLPQEKELIEQALGPTISSYYGMNEVGYLAHLCMVRGGFHVNRANILLEIVGDDNQPLPPGKQGKILVTAFVNEVMPFVKYNTGDVGSFIEEKCPCGRTSPRISLVGRRDDMLELPNGKKIHSSQFHPIFYEFANSVLKYQIAFSRHQPPTVLVVPSAAWDQKTRSRLSQKLSSLLGPNFTIETVGDIPPLPSGKFQTVRRLS